VIPPPPSGSGSQGAAAPAAQTVPLTGQPVAVPQQPAAQTVPLTGQPVAVPQQPAAQTVPLTGQPTRPTVPGGGALLPQTGNSHLQDATLSYIGMALSLLLFAVGSVLVGRERHKRGRRAFTQR